MGGKSHSEFFIDKDESDSSSFVAFNGVTNLNGGGFCSVKDSMETPADLSSFAGICVSLRSAAKHTFEFGLTDHIVEDRVWYGDAAVEADSEKW